MVCKFLRKGMMVFQCEYCEFGYLDLETAEACEEFCGRNRTCSHEISRKAVYRPTIRIIPISA